jgi:hypothetical protein
MRLVAVVLALLLAAPAAAQDKPVWVGLWEGTVGTYPVRLCVDVWSNGPARGSYYYLTRLEPIALSEEDGEGGWIELAPEGVQQALWEFAEQTGTRLRGIWRQGARRLPFDLAPVPWTEGEWGGPCAADEFIAARLGGGNVTEETADIRGWRYSRRIYRPAAHFADEVMIESFSFSPERAGDEAINAILAAYLPNGTLSDEFVQCFSGAIGQHGVDGYFEQLVMPKLTSRAFLTVHEANSNYCGGTRPSHWFRQRTFDRASGMEIDLFDWVGGGLDDDSYGTGELPPVLLAEVLAHWPADPAEDIDDCREVVSITSHWNLELRREGLAFWPQVPHVALPCGAESLLGWDELAAFLDAEGKAGLARLRED